MSAALSSPLVGAPFLSADCAADSSSGHRPHTARIKSDTKNGARHGRLLSKARTTAAMDWNSSRQLKAMLKRMPFLCRLGDASQGRGDSTLENAAKDYLRHPIGGIPNELAILAVTLPNWQPEMFDDWLPGRLG